KWEHGRREFVFPYLDDALRRPGCSLHRLTLDRDVGEEVYALFREEPPHAEAYLSVYQVTLNAHKGLLRTPFGVVAFIVWEICPGTEMEARIEQYINPFEIGALKLVSDAANQSHFKLIIVDID